jgi:hypothetical protein
MRRVIAGGLVVAMSLGVPVGAFAAGRSVARQDSTIKGDAKGSNGEKLAQNKVRIRNSSTGQVAADVTTDAAGNFTGAVPAGSYIVEIVDANGTVIGVSPVLTVAAGATATISVTASAVAAVAGAGAAAGGLSIFGLGTVTSIAIIGAAATATVFGIKAVKNDASPAK